MNTTELRALLAKATPGPWARERALGFDLGCDAEVVIDSPSTETWNIVHADDADANLVVAMRNALPELLDAVDALKVAEDLIDDLMPYATQSWDWKYGDYWREQQAKVRAALGIENGDKSTIPNVTGDEK